jgi:hypothetical protein
MFFFSQEEAMASSLTRRQALGSGIATALFLAPGVASAATRFAVVSIVNETQANLVISYRWGDGEWKQTRLGPSARHWWSYKYPNPNENRSPDFHLKFDADTSSSKYTEPKKLHGFAAAEENFDLGHKYAFRYDGPSKRYIEIFDISR